MINFILTILLTLVSVEIILFHNIRLLFRKLIKLLSRVIFTLKNRRISDHWKEKAILSYALSLLVISFKFSLCVFYIVIMIYLGGLFYPSLLDFIVTYTGLSTSVVTALTYVYVRQKLKA